MDKLYSIRDIKIAYFRLFRGAGIFKPDRTGESIKVSWQRFQEELNKTRR
ncbi:hypothetical protein ES703_00373 [subsurface metagenome]